MGCLVGAPRAAADPKLYERSLDSVVFIISRGEKDEFSLGSGSLVNGKQRIILTNFHVVGEREAALVFFPAYKGNELITSPEYYLKNSHKVGIKGKVVARAKERDLALIRLDSVPEVAHEIRLAMRSPKPGETLHALGNSGAQLGALWRYSKGEVRQIYMRKFSCGNPPFEVNARIVETQIPINSGDSGGPVINAAGELTAVSQGYQPQETQRLVSNMIDISEVRAFLKQEKMLPIKKEAGTQSKTSK
jgi:S1-C subfamily serine protease